MSQFIVHIGIFLGVLLVSVAILDLVFTAVMRAAGLTKNKEDL